MPESTPRQRATAPLGSRGFWIVFVLNLIWQNISEVARYFGVLMPLIREAVPQISGAAPMSLGIFLVWGIWDTLLVLVVTGFIWIALERFGGGLRNALLAATAVWIACFVLLWVGVWNMGLTSLTVVLVALPLAWVEVAVAGLIVNWGMQRFAD